MSKTCDTKSKELLKELREAETRRNQAHLEILDHYALTRGWELQGQDVLYKYFAEKYHWTPAQVRSLTFEEIEVLLHNEIGF